MTIKMGKHILELRRAKGMTQRQLASALGVSTPAVSKWERDISCPDITILCPLARVLDTNVDTLLQFEELLTDEEVSGHMNKIIEKARKEGRLPAETALLELLHTYPSSIALKYQAAMAIDMFRMMFQKEDEEKQKQWKEKKKYLLEEVSREGSSVYWQNAVSGLAAMAIQEEDIDHAERLLSKLPERTTDVTMLRTQIYLKRSEAAKAAEVVQKQLYMLVGQIQTCLLTMMNADLEPDAEKALEIGAIYRQVEAMFGLGGGFGIGVLAEIYQRLGNEKELKDCLMQLIETAISPFKMPNPLLFSSFIKRKEKHTEVPREMKQMVLKGIMESEFCGPLLEDPDFMQAVERLRLSAEKIH